MKWKELPEKDLANPFLFCRSKDAIDHVDEFLLVYKDSTEMKTLFYGDWIILLRSTRIGRWEYNKKLALKIFWKCPLLFSFSDPLFEEFGWCVLKDAPEEYQETKKELLEKMDPSTKEMIYWRWGTPEKVKEIISLRTTPVEGWLAMRLAMGFPIRE